MIDLHKWDYLCENPYIVPDASWVGGYGFSGAGSSHTPGYGMGCGEGFDDGRGIKPTGDEGPGCGLGFGTGEAWPHHRPLALLRSRDD